MEQELDDYHVLDVTEEFPKPKQKYWKVLKYCFEPGYNKRYPYLVEVELQDESKQICCWRIPEITEEYDMSEAIKLKPEEFWKR